MIERLMFRLGWVKRDKLLETQIAAIELNLAYKAYRDAVMTVFKAYNIPLETPTEPEQLPDNVIRFKK